jgi:beta-lactamase superfamily II metal-dependent hydrolase
MNRSSLMLLSFAMGLTAVLTLHAQQVGDVFQNWSSGTLDIHHINTGRGECVFCVLPDGTTLLIDAGATKRSKPRVTDQRPDSSRTPGEWISRYIDHMLRSKSQKTLDYALLTHFHGDHMGEINEKSKLSRSGKFRLSGITEIGDNFDIKKMIDRGWPDYSYPEPLESQLMKNYRNFLAYHQAQYGMLVERFKPGVKDQITLVNQPAQYDNFEIRNIAANGEIWTGVAANTRKHIPPYDEIPEGDKPSENMCSIAFRLSYGAFDYFTGGDLVGIPDDGAPAWHDIETPVAKAVGPVDVNELNHHGYLDSENAFFLATLIPRVHVIQVWAPSHPSPRTLRRLLSTRLYPGPRDIFATNMMEANKVVIGSNLEKLKSDQGHIVIRVEPGGAAYKVIILDDATESHRIKAIHGPYDSR